MTRAAIPRSRLHLAFLVANDAAPDLVLFRELSLSAEIEQAFPGKGIYLGRETRPGHNILKLPAVFRANRHYYQTVADRIAELRIDSLIIFLEAEPLERFICQLPAIDTIELWEDGLSHYVDLTGAAWYAARGLVQAASGFYPRRITRRRIDRSRVLVRDRFVNRNLRLATPAPPTQHREELLLIGSPLVEDRIITPKALLRACQAVAQASPWPVRYLMHPREDSATIHRLSAIPGLIVDRNPGGLSAHAESHGYRAYVTAVSTGLLDLGFHDASFFIPNLFGLKKMDRVLSNWDHNPISVVPDPASLRSRLDDIAFQAPAGKE